MQAPAQPRHLPVPAPAQSLQETWILQLQTQHRPMQEKPMQQLQETCLSCMHAQHRCCLQRQV
jgi:hypothetical protein